jgi:hypothetical protein
MYVLSQTIMLGHFPFHLYVILVIIKSMRGETQYMLSQTSLLPVYIHPRRSSLLHFT